MKHERTKQSRYKAGMLVDVVLKEVKRTGTLTRGHVKRILTNSQDLPHGIKVILARDGAMLAEKLNIY